MKIVTLNDETQVHALWCPACGYAHRFQTHEGVVVWNYDRENPTVWPRIVEETEGYRCHSLVTRGRISFLSSSTHAMRLQTVELPEWPDELGER